MEQNTRIYYDAYGASAAPENGGFDPAQGYGEEEYEQEDYTQEDYSAEGPYEGYGVYDAEEDDLGGEGMDGDGFSDDEDYSVYNEELDGAHRFHMAMNVFNTVSVLAGVVVILALTTLIISLISWFRSDIMHSFVLLQSGIQ